MMATAIAHNALTPIALAAKLDVCNRLRTNDVDENEQNHCGQMVKGYVNTSID